MNFLLKSPGPKRRRSDKNPWEECLEPMTVDALAQRLCPPGEWEAHCRRVARFSGKGSLYGDIKVFPTWKRYRQKAQKVAKLQHALPMLKWLPLQVSVLLGELLPC